MAGFGATDYFNQRVNALEAADRLNPPQDKLAELERAGAEKKAALSAMADAGFKRAELNKGSVIGHLGLDLDTGAGAAVNMTAQTLAGLSKNVIGNTAALGPDLAATAAVDGLSERDYLAYSNYSKGIANSDDLAILNSPKEALPGTTPGFIAPPTLGITKLEAFQKANQQRDIAQGIRKTLDIDYIAHTAATDKLTDQLGAGFQDRWDLATKGWDQLTNGSNLDEKAQGLKNGASALGGLIFDAGKAAVDNPQGAMEYVAQNLPQLAVGMGKHGMAALSATNAGYAFDNYNQGIQKWQKDHGGALPPEDERRRMATIAASLALAENVGELTQLRALAPKKAIKAAAEGAAAAAKATEDAAKTGIVKAAAATAKETGLSIASEAATEGYQTWGEDEITGQEASAKDIYTSAAIGGIVGGVTSGSLAGATEVAKVGAAAKAAGEKANAQKADTSTAVTKAVESEDVSELVKTAPHAAVSALAQIAAKEGKTQDEKQAAVDQASQILSDLEAKHAVIQKNAQAYTPEGVAEIQKELDDTKAQAAAETEPGLKGLYDTEIKRLETELASRQNKEAAATNKSRLARAEKQMEEARASMTAFAKDVATVAVDVDSEVAKVKTDAKAGDTLINLAMAAPERLDPKVAQSLADDATNALSDAQRASLRKFSEARVAENRQRDMGKVSKEIVEGSDQNKGLVQYRANVADALVAGNTQQAERELVGLTKFRDDHQDKFAVAQEAQDRPNGAQIIKAEGKWQIAAKPLSPEELRKNGGLYIHPNSNKLVENIGKDAETIALVHDELSHAISQKGAKNVPVVPQAQPSAPKDPSAAHQEVAAAGSPATQTGGRSASGRAGVVETAGVKAETKPEPASPPRDSQKAEKNVTEDQQTSVEPGVSDALEGVKQPEEATTVNKERNQEDTTNNVVDSGSQPQQKSAEQTSNEVEQPQGQLEGVSNRSEDNPKLNLVADNFTQSASKEGDVTQRPLVAVKNFLSSAYQALRDYLTSDDLSNEQVKALKEFRKVAKLWQPEIQKLLARKSGPDFYYEDLMQFLMQETEQGLDVEENLKTAIAYAAWAWVAENATRPSVNTDEEINAILGRDDNATVTEDERKALGSIGTRQNVVINSLGQKVAQALGLSANSSAHQDMGPRMESALGVRVLTLLVNEGIIDRKTYDGEAFAALTGSSTTNTDAEFHFIKLARNEKYELSPKAEHIFESNRGSKSVLDKLFGVESGLRDPAFDPKEFKAQKSIRNTRQRIPDALAKIIEHENGVPNHLREDMWHLISGLEDNHVLQIAGWENPEERFTHKANRESKRAKNDGLTRELNNFKDFVEFLWTPQGLDSPIYLEHTVWKQQRVGIATNAVNPQTSKIHRHMLFRPDWATTIDPNNQEQLDNFRLRVLEGMGVKTDKQSNEKSLAEWDKKTKSPKIQAAVAAIRERIDGAGLTPRQQMDIVEGVKEAGEGMHSLDALVALAKESSDTPFEVHLMGEVDGVTNGPMLTHLLLGAATSVKELFGLLNRGGFFQVGSGHQNYNVWRGEPGHSDLYETLAKTMGDNVPKVIEAALNPKDEKKKPNPKVRGVFDAIYKFTGELVDKNGTVLKAGRNIVKTPLTAMVFGSATGKAVDSMADKFIEGIYAAVEDVAKGKGKLSTQEIIQQANTILGYSNAKQIPSDLSTEKLMEYTFDAKQIGALKKAFRDTLGKATRMAMEENFAVFMERRTVYNQAAQLAFELHNAVYTGLRQQLINELIEKEKAEPGTGLPFRTTKKGEIVPLHDLTAAQESTLRKRLTALAPVLNTYFSKESGSLASGLSISKSGRKLSQEATYGQEVKQTVNGKATYTNTHAYEQRETSPGVAMLPMGVHAADSAVSHTGLDGRQVLNVHDAHGSGVGGFIETAQHLNQATWNVMLNYSPAHEMAEALSRTVTGLAQMLEQGNLPEEVTANLNTALAKLAEKLGSSEDPMSAGMVVPFLMHSVRQLAHQADSMKLEAMSQMQALDQYALEGGQYVVTEEDRTEAAKRQRELPKGMSEQEEKAIETITKALTGEKAESTHQQDPEMDPSVLGSETVAEAIPAQIQMALQKVAQSSDYTKEQRALADKILDRMDRGESFAGALKEATLSLLAAEVVQATAQNKPESAFGELGEPQIRPDASLVGFLEANPNASVREVLRQVYRSIRDGNDSNKEFQLELLKKLVSVVGNDLKIKYITKDTPASEALELPASASRGWYVAKGGQEEIYVLSPDFVASGLTAETLLHELTHGAVAQVVAQNATPEVQALVAELEALMKRAQEYVNKEHAGKYGAPLSNVQEFIAWGMTNLDFQENVLKKISMQSKTKSNSLVDGMKAFIKTLVDLVFVGSDKSRQAKTVNGMSLLIGNVSGLFAQASQTQKAAGLNLSQATNINGTQDMSTLDIHEALNAGSISSEFDTHLRNVLGGIVETLYGPFGSFKKKFMTSQSNPVDAWINALKTGKAPYASKLMAANVRMSQKEAHAIEQVESTVRAALTDIAATKFAYKELKDLYDETREHLAKTDPAALKQFDFVFDPQLNADGKSDYLAQFAAMALAHEEFRGLLAFGTAMKDNGIMDGKTLADKVQRLFEKILSFFSDLVTKTFDGQQADNKLDALVEQLVGIEAKRRATLATPSNPLVDSLEQGSKRLADGARKKVVELANSSFVKNSTNGFVKGAAGIAKTWAGDRMELWMDAAANLRDKHFKERYGVAASLLKEFTGQPGKLQALLRNTKHELEQKRKAIITSAAKMALAGFKDGGKDFKKNDKNMAAISQVVLRSGMFYLKEGRTMAELESLVSDKAALNAEIAKLEAQLKPFGKRANYFIYQANALGYFKATGKAKSARLMLNAHNIANLFGTSVQRLDAQKTEQAKAVIEQLVSLYTLDYMPAEHLTAAKKIFTTENARTDGNGIEALIAQHKYLDADARERIFGGRPELMIHGFTPEIYNPNTQLQMADEVEGALLEQQGYVKGAELAKDPADPDRHTKHIYVLRDGGLQPYLSGIMSMTGIEAKGTKQHSGFLNVNHPDGLENAQLQALIYNAKQQQNPIQNMFKDGPRIDLEKIQGTHLVPLVNEQGGIVNWRYMMQESTKDNLLERDNSFNTLMGMLAGSTFDKETTPKINAQAVDALHEDYRKNFNREDKSGWTKIGPNVTDAEMRDLWKLLPDHTKGMIRGRFGRDEFHVRTSTLDIMFGYRKRSLSEIFRKDPDARNLMEKVTAEVIGFAIKSAAIVQGKDTDQAMAQAAVKVIRAERMWQEVVRETKDLIVIKTGVVMLGNIWSNISLLALNGVPLKDMLRDHLVALKAATAYMKDSEELMRLENLLASGYTQGNEEDIKRQVVRLKDSIARNPVKPLIDEGLMPTIVEDLGQQDDIYSYKSQFARKVDKYTSKLNPMVLTAAKNVYMTHDTAQYQAFSRITQLSDFVARYALYQHLTNRKNDKRTHEQAIQEASDAFINYDVPMHRDIQWADDMGFIPFTKYFLRIQKVLVKLGREHPARVLMALALNNFMDLGPIVLDSAAVGRIGNNPLQAGAFLFPGQLDELATVQAGMALFR